MDKAEAITKRQELWGDALSYGFVGVPTLLLKHQGDLQISPQEMVVLLNLLASWWEAGNLPFPRTTTIASRSGLSVRVVQRQLLSLERCIVAGGYQVIILTHQTFNARHLCIVGVNISVVVWHPVVVGHNVISCTKCLQLCTLTIQ